MKKILCYGDSNTYGYDARSYLGSRFPKEIRWTGILDQDPETEIRNYGMNGREIPDDRWDLKEVTQIVTKESPFDLMTIMLGTNDMMFTYQKRLAPVADRMDRLLAFLTGDLSVSPAAILLIAPPQLELARYGQEHLDALSRELPQEYEKLAKKYGTHYVNAVNWNLKLCPDGAHLTPESHRRFAMEMQTAFRQIFD